MESFAVERAERPVCSAAQPDRLLNHGIEDWLKVAGRRIDDLQHLGGGGLLLQRLARLVNQTRILHRDDRLRGETLQQRDLLVSEWKNFFAMHDDRPEQRLVFSQRDHY